MMLGSRSHRRWSRWLCLVVFPCSASAFSPLSALLPLSAVICEPSEDPLNVPILLSCFKIFTKFCISLVTRVASVASFSLKQSRSGKLPVATPESRYFVLSSFSPTQEGVTDFRALRAKFQNDSNLANKLVQPRKKPPPEILPKLGSGGNAVSKPLPLSKKEVIILKSKDEPAHPATQRSTHPQRNPFAWPRAQLRYVEPTEHNEEHKGNVLEKGLSSPKNGPEKPLPPYCADRQGSAQTSPEGPQLPNSFHHALRMWENALSRGEKSNAMLPTQRAANLYVHPCPEQRVMHAPAALGGSRMRPPGNEPTLDLPAQKKDGPHGSGSVLPQAPGGHRSSDEAAAESAAATVFCQLGYRAPGERQKGILSYTLNDKHIYICMHMSINVYKCSESAGCSSWREKLFRVGTLKQETKVAYWSAPFLPWRSWRLKKGVSNCCRAWVKGGVPISTKFLKIHFKKLPKF